MKPVDQEFIHRPEEGQYGDCTRAVLASLLERPLASVPHFLCDGTNDGEVFHRRINLFLKPLNLAFMVVDASFDIKDWQSRMGVYELYHEMSGTTSRSNDVLHSCVGFNGELAHDPHPSKTGLVEVKYFGLLVALDPSFNKRTQYGPR